MINLNVSSDVARLTRHLREIEKRHIPFATATALNAVARHAQASITGQLPSIFDAKGKPTPFTLRAIGTTPARKSDLTATVLVKPLQAKYLTLEDEGGFRSSASGKMLPEPVAIQTNAYHNIPRNKIAQLAAKPGYFIGEVKGINGLWKRPPRGKQRGGMSGTKGALNTTQGFKTGLTLIARWVKGWSIQPKFRFAERVGTDVSKTLPAALHAAIEKALTTAR